MNESLILIGQLCDNNCQVLFHKLDCTISHNNQISLRGKRYKIDGLWDLSIQKINKQYFPVDENIYQTNFIITNDKIKNGTSTVLSCSFLLAMHCHIRTSYIRWQLIVMAQRKFKIFKTNQNINCNWKRPFGSRTAKYKLYRNTSRFWCISGENHRLHTQCLHDGDPTITSWTNIYSKIQIVCWSNWEVSTQIVT